MTIPHLKPSGRITVVKLQVLTVFFIVPLVVGTILGVGLYRGLHDHQEVRFLRSDARVLPIDYIFESTGGERDTHYELQCSGIAKDIVNYTIWSCPSMEDISFTEEANVTVLSGKQPHYEALIGSRLKGEELPPGPFSIVNNGDEELTIEPFECETGREDVFILSPGQLLNRSYSCLGVRLSTSSYDINATINNLAVIRQPPSCHPITTIVVPCSDNVRHVGLLPSVENEDSIGNDNIPPSSYIIFKNNDLPVVRQTTNGMDLKINLSNGRPLLPWEVCFISAVLCCLTCSILLGVAPKVVRSCHRFSESPLLLHGIRTLEEVDYSAYHELPSSSHGVEH
ncbi:hypothetical protein GMRT_12795 [Giardia muris]|uniref:Uncharacterized protein n=1 Tax=Giardia muris TaxID=5742 RepID=A0A4Z1SQE0_GIAMU|nr:hypothetical protein GMRT_12795 [Giardia muris]|eukprot:TNJ27125.1 hypothetical protein GMRT_12795 [Giardia muris]